MLKSSSAGGYLGVPLRVGLFAASPRYAVGFPLQSLTWVKGLSLSCADTLAHGLSCPGVRFRPFRQAAWPKPNIGGGRTNGTRPSVPSHGMKFIIGISLSRPSLSRMNRNSYFTFAVISSIRFVIFSMEYFSINLLFAASVFNFSLINFSWGRSDWQHSFKYSISVP